MARTAHTARKSVGSSKKTRRSEDSKKVSEKQPTRSMSVKTPVISTHSKPKKTKHDYAKNVLKEIAYYQSVTRPLVAKASVVRLIRGIVLKLQRHTSSGPFKFSNEALNILHEVLENHLTLQMELAYLAARHAKRVTLFESDIRLICRIRSCDSREPLVPSIKSKLL